MCVELVSGYLREVSKIGTNKKDLLEFLSNMPGFKKSSITFATIFRKEYNENFSSAWLAFLLTPKLFGSAEVLEAFLEIIDLSEEETDLDELEVRCEQPFDDRRRIDIFLETSNYIIGIENKINAVLGNNQLEDYATSLKALAAPPENDKGEKKGVEKKWKLVFLTPDHYPVPKVGEHVHVKYSELYNAFSKIKLDFIENLRGAFLMRDYLTYIEEHIMKQDDFNSVLFVGKNYEKFNDAKKISRPGVQLFKKRS